MRSLIIAFALVLLAGCSSATVAKTLTPTATTYYPIIPTVPSYSTTVTPYPTATVSPLKPTSLLMVDVPGTFSGWKYPAVQGSTSNAQDIAQFGQIVAGLTIETANPGPSCPSDENYNLLITERAGSQTIWSGLAEMDHCNWLRIGSNIYYTTNAFWSLLSKIAGQPLPATPQSKS